VVDLTDATFIESTILRVLLGALRLVHERDLELELVLPPHAEVRRMFDVAGVLPVVSVHPSRERALADAALWARRQAERSPRGRSTPGASRACRA
jgi:anti-anti-sigma regulatory factor